MAKTKYRKKTGVMIDLSDRKNMQIIPAEHSLATDEDVKNFEDKLDDRYSTMRNFSDYCIQQNNTNLLKESIPDEVFNETLNQMLKKHKLLKSMLKEPSE